MSHIAPIMRSIVHADGHTISDIRSQTGYPTSRILPFSLAISPLARISESVR
jgi:hypothetical protein